MFSNKWELKMGKFFMLVAFCGLLLGACSSDPGPTVEPIIITYEITAESYYESGDGAINITVTGGSAPYSYVWSNGETIEDLVNIGSGDYTVTVNDATGQSESVQITLQTPTEGRVTDFDGNVYKTVKIGSQWWMAENLKVTHDPVGNEITSCYYNDDPANLETYGRLYSFNTAMNRGREGSQGIAPDGWHIPSVTEWEELFNSLGGKDIAGGKMKSTGTDHWTSPNVNATNSSRFNALGGGEREGDRFQFFHRIGIFWTSNSSGSSNAKYYYLENNKEAVTQRTYLKTLEYSIRCVKD